MGAYEEGRVVRMLREVQTLLRHLPRRLELASYVMSQQTVQDMEELRGLTQLLAQRACPGKAVFHFRG